MNLWRVMMKPDAEKDYNPANYCLKEGIVGIGWGITGEPPLDLESYCERAREERDDHRSLKRNLTIMWEVMQRGDLCWIRDEFTKRYHLGKIVGDRFYLDTELARRHHIRNVRACRWVQRTYAKNEVPDRIFIGEHRHTIVRVTDEEAIRKSLAMHESANGDSGGRI